MRKFLAPLVAVCVLSAASSALAAPKLVYNDANGNIQWVNDSGAVMGAAIIKSAGSLLKADPGSALAIPNTTLDTGDLPFALTYLNMPVGSFDGGNIVTPGTPLGDLTFEWYGSLTAPVNIGPVELIPEPASLALIASASLMALAIRRRSA